MLCHLSFRRYRLPFRQVVRTAHGPWAAREGLIVRLEGPGGAVGWGEAAPMAGFGTETVEEAERACAALGGEVTAERIAGLPGNLRCLKSALHAAWKDQGRADPPGPPVGRGGPGGSALPSSLPIAALLPAGKAALAEAGPKAEAGFRTFKWKVAAGDAGDELGLLDDLCAALPAGAKLRLDANGGWDRRQAERWLDRCADRPVEFVEQPVSPDRRGAADILLGLSEDYPTPLALDESLGGDGDVARWLEAAWRGIFVLKPSLLANARETVGRLAAARAEVVFSSALETAVGARAALRTAFAWTGSRRALGFGVWPLFADPRFDGPAAAPFLLRADVDRIDPTTLWNELN